MADFWIADRITGKHEGFYSNHPSDAGGETLWGIARKRNPQWRGWAIVDNYRKQSNFPANMRNDQNLHRLRGEFYKTNFWNPIRGDEIRSQRVANEIYDTGVNMGVSVAIRFARKTAGLSESGRMNDELIKKLNQLV